MPADRDRIPNSDKGVVPEENDIRIVGIGASAGGLVAAQDFFAAMPDQPDIAFVLIQHLAPDHQSEMAEILQNHTSLTVSQARQDGLVESNHVYTIPPGQIMQLSNGRLKLTPSNRDQHHMNAPIDVFFRTLAQECAESGACVILSGTGSDGTEGLRAVKEAGGMVLIQDPADAEYEGMPRSAVATGLGDLVAPAGQLARKLVEFSHDRSAINLPEVPESLEEDGAEALSRILAQLRGRTGHDFSHYKRSSILRRLSRRLQLLDLTTSGEYLDHVRREPEELDGLFRDLLISVTNFFRDPEAWESLEEIIPKLFEGKTQADTIRVWVPGCATGEEAYTIAMLLSAHASGADQAPALQVFATDIDEDALSFAREGFYPDTVSADLPPHLLSRFFDSEGNTVRIRKPIRDMVLFASHNLLQDAPYSRLDLITCRNLLIYLSRDVQETVLDVFHYALRPDGYMFLGSSESAEGADRIFRPLNKRHRLYQRRASPPRVPTYPTIAAAELALVADSHSRRGADHTAADRHRDHLIAHRVPPALLVNSDYELCHAAGGAHRFLREVDGVPTQDLLKKILPEMRLDLRAALFQAFQSGEPVTTTIRSVDLDGAPHDIEVEVMVLDEQRFQGNFAEIILNVVEESSAKEARQLLPGDALLTSQLEQELDRTRDRLQTIIEEYETANEELQASNEELQSMNEELRSTTEELETGREELQSMNEELVTVNHELRVKIEELGRANSDLNNLMAATEIGTLFIDRDLRIKRYTPKAEEFFHLMPADVGRPLRALTQKLHGDDLVTLCEEVLSNLIMVEREQATPDGRWFMTRIRPYRTLADAIDGVVVTFVDVTELKSAERTAHFQAGVLEQVHDAVIAVGLDERIIYLNQAAIVNFGLSPLKSIGQKLSKEISIEYGSTSSRELAGKAVAGGEEWRGDVVYVTKDGKRHDVEARIAALEDDDGNRIGSLGLMRDVTKRKEAENLARERQHYLSTALRNVPLFASITDTDLRYRWVHNPDGTQPEDDILGQTDRDLFGEEQSAALTQLRREVMHYRKSVRRELVFKDDSGIRVYDVTADPILDEEGVLVGVSTAGLDITSRRQHEEQLKRAKLEAEVANESKAAFLAAMSHELRTPLNAITGYVDLMELGVPDPLTNSQLDHVARVRVSARHLLQVIEEILQFARVDAGRETAELADITSSDLFEEIEAIGAPLAASKGLELRLLKQEAPPLIRSDPRKLRQILLNLVGNAVKFTPEGRVELRITEEEDDVVFHVIDTGVGLSEADIENIFQPFWQSDSSLSRTSGGSGLGLTISRRYLDLIGGSIKVRSSLGHGSAFTIRIPRNPDDDLL